MKMISKQPNPSGSYPPIQEVAASAPYPGMAWWPDDLETDTFYDNNGFVNIVFAESTDGTFAMVDSYTPNPSAKQEWEDSIPEPEPEPEPEPTEVEQLRADVDYIAVMTGVEL